jgi:hypothetical protein
MQHFDDGGTSTVVLEVSPADDLLRVPVPGRKMPLSASGRSVGHKLQHMLLALLV